MIMQYPGERRRWRPMGEEAARERDDRVRENMCGER
jgi:hypothetical protein